MACPLNTPGWTLGGRFGYESNAHSSSHGIPTSSAMFSRINEAVREEAPDGANADTSLVQMAINAAMPIDNFILERFLEREQTEGNRCRVLLKPCLQNYIVPQKDLRWRCRCVAPSTLRSQTASLVRTCLPLVAICRSPIREGSPPRTNYEILIEDHRQAPRLPTPTYAR